MDWRSMLGLAGKEYDVNAYNGDYLSRKLKDPTLETSNNTGLVAGGDGLTGTEMLGLANLGLKGLGAFTDWQQLGLAKDTLAFNKMNANRNYEAERTKYNNAYDRTDAVNKVYGSQTVGTKI